METTFRSLNFVLLEEFLVPQELKTLLNFTLRHRADFQIAKVRPPESPDGEVDYYHRRAKVLLDLGKVHTLFAKRIHCFLPWVCNRLRLPLFHITELEAQITASNDGDHFGLHNDSGYPFSTRELSFVYYYHNEPKAFTGGELRIHEMSLEWAHIPSDTFDTVLPAQNCIVFFPSFLMHQIMPVRCQSRRLSDSRFTVNGWLHKNRGS